MGSASTAEMKQTFQDNNAPIPGAVVAATSSAGRKQKLRHSDCGFKTLGMTKSMVGRCKELGFTVPSGVQAACIPPILNGDNVIANSPTGTGKTLAFAIPIVQQCNNDPHPAFSLVLTPTRELASQIADQFRSIGGASLSVACIIGGMDFQVQAQELESRPLYIVATPGRLADHFESNVDRMKGLFKNLKYLVIDEADRVLDGRFDKQLKTIMNTIPNGRRQTLFFSATMTDDLRLLARAMSATKDPFVYDYFENKSGELIVNRLIKQQYVFCPTDYKDGYLIEFLRIIRDEGLIRSMIIFAPTCKDCNIIGAMMRELSFENLVLHSHMKQKERSESLSCFKSKRWTTLVATDVASRGLDIPSVDLVINYSVPFGTDYVHRIGRAGRAGQIGFAVTFVTSRDIPYLHTVESYIGEKLSEFKVEEKRVLLILNEVNAMKRQVMLRVENDPHNERLENYERKRQFDSEDSDSSTCSDETSMQDVIGRRKPKRTKHNPPTDKMYAWNFVDVA